MPAGGGLEMAEPQMASCGGGVVGCHPLTYWDRTGDALASTQPRAGVADVPMVP